MLNMFIGIVCEAFAEAVEETGDITLADEINTAYEDIAKHFAEMNSNKAEEDELAKVAAMM